MIASSSTVDAPLVRVATLATLVSVTEQLQQVATVVQASHAAMGMEPDRLVRLLHEAAGALSDLGDWLGRGAPLSRSVQSPLFSTDTPAHLASRPPHASDAARWCGGNCTHVAP